MQRGKILRRILVIFIIILCSCASCCVILPKLINPSPSPPLYACSNSSDAQATEICNVVENFEGNWNSLEAHMNPAVQSGLATGPYLEFWSYVRWGDKLYESPYWTPWSVTISATVKSVGIIEYSDERLKITAHVIRGHNTVEPGGEFIQYEGVIETCSVYVFVREDDTWKMAGLFNMSNPQHVQRDWDYEEPWLKEIIGELPHDPCGWLRAGYYPPHLTYPPPLSPTPENNK